MGVALDSFVITVEYAGIVAIVLLVYCLFARHMNNSGTLGFFQRKVILLPAIGFLVTIILVTNLGITPMAEYQGLNSKRTDYASSGHETTFTLREQFMYSGYLEVTGSKYLLFDESAHVEVAVFQNDSLIDTASFDFQYTGLEPIYDPFEPDPRFWVSAQCDIALEPGTYNVQVNFTIYFEGNPVEAVEAIDLTLSQPLISGFINEVVDWSTYQFVLNISIVLLLLGGLCLDFPSKKPPKVDETDWRTTTEYEY
ncbi:MAG: hypothetical protein KAU48_02865 [Candidatus Thorarchaeota archaeon]|nr:hypothetical protein [Candidatus Thorarchaeota archaeon]